LGPTIDFLNRNPEAAADVGAESGYGIGLAGRVRTPHVARPSTRTKRDNDDRTSTRRPLAPHTCESRAGVEHQVIAEPVVDWLQHTDAELHCLMDDRGLGDCPLSIRCHNRQR
jgi:hypothetical protein